MGAEAVVNRAMQKAFARVINEGDEEALDQLDPIEERTELERVEGALFVKLREGLAPEQVGLLESWVCLHELRLMLSGHLAPPLPFNWRPVLAEAMELREVMRVAYLE